MLTEDLKAQIIQHADESKYEVCGYLISSAGQITVEKKENLINSATEFLMEGSDDNIVAYYHSHVDYNNISEADKIVSERLKLECIVYDKKSETFHTYTPNGYRIKYTERPFLLGFADCVWLVKDYYLSDLNVTLCSESEALKRAGISEEECDFLISKRCVNESALLEERPTYLRRYFEINNFREVQDFKKHDVLICRTAGSNFPIHCMIYLGNGNVLHHPSDSASKIEKLSKQQKRWVIYIMRHN